MDNEHLSCRPFVPKSLSHRNSCTWNLNFSNKHIEDFHRQVWKCPESRWVYCQRLGSESLDATSVLCEPQHPISPLLALRRGLNFLPSPSLLVATLCCSARQWLWELFSQEGESFLKENTRTGWVVDRCGGGDRGWVVFQKEKWVGLPQGEVPPWGGSLNDGHV